LISKLDSLKKFSAMSERVCQYTTRSMAFHVVSVNIAEPVRDQFRLLSSFFISLFSPAGSGLCPEPNVWKYAHHLY